MRYSKSKICQIKAQEPWIGGDPGLRALAQARSISTNTCFLGFLVFQEDSQRMREEIESLHRKFEALKRFAAQKKVRLPLEFDQQAAYMWKKNEKGTVSNTDYYNLCKISIHLKSSCIPLHLCLTYVCVFLFLPIAFLRRGCNDHLFCLLFTFRQNHQMWHLSWNCCKNNSLCFVFGQSKRPQKFVVVDVS